MMHERWKCIGCGACTAVAPEHWEMADDGYADLVDSRHSQTEDGILEEKTLTPDQVDENQNAADSCPADCIHIKEKI